MYEIGTIQGKLRSFYFETYPQHACILASFGLRVLVASCLEQSESLCSAARIFSLNSRLHLCLKFTRILCGFFYAEQSTKFSVIFAIAPIKRNQQYLLHLDVLKLNR